MVSVDAEALGIVLAGFGAEERDLFKIAQALEKIKQSYYVHLRTCSGNLEIEVGDIVEPKVGHNFLRAGNTAYGEAVVLSINPFYIASSDGKMDWRDNSPINFTIKGRADSNTMLFLNHIWKINE